MIDLNQGEPPWKPSADAEIDCVLHYYDGPRIGVLRQHGVQFLFNAMVDRADGFGLWSYTRVDLTPEALASLDDLEGEDFDREVEAMTLSRPGTLAAVGGGRLLAWTYVSYLTEPDDG